MKFVVKILTSISSSSNVLCNHCNTSAMVAIRSIFLQREVPYRNQQWRNRSAIMDLKNHLQTMSKCQLPNWCNKSESKVTRVLIGLIWCTFPTRLDIFNNISDRRQMRRNGRTFSQGVDLRGPLALSVTQREGAAKPPRRPCPHDSS